MRNHSNENEFDLHENGHVFESHFHMNGFAPRLVLKQRQRVTRKWPISGFHLSVESDSHLLWFCIITLSDWFKKLAPLSRPIRSNIKTNRDSLAHFFPRFVPAACLCFEF